MHSITVDASSIQFQYYTSGIYSDNSCSQSNLNHALLVVGYGTDSSSGIDYWILKNRYIHTTYNCMYSHSFFYNSLLRFYVQLGQILGKQWLYENDSKQEHVWSSHSSKLSNSVNVYNHHTPHSLFCRTTL